MQNFLMLEHAQARNFIFEHARARSMLDYFILDATLAMVEMNYNEGLKWIVKIFLFMNNWKSFQDSLTPHA